MAQALRHQPIGLPTPAQRLRGTGATSPRKPPPDADHELWQAARKLPKKQAQAIVLRYVDDLEANQIAEIMECQPSTVPVHLTRARAALATTLGGSSEEATAVDGSTIAPFISESEATA